ncbi:hypothetical protein BU26DRAFT_442836 [Trematosphaeria pertusa]|uniref:Aminoglycoside phosphotransferase domain-containing protein n=1 Tax=Trematosphaeria pertusa TaxID=390896 RepID=A0A6A6HQD4_9PLEO|nr:uncharacterized protein BU26DRAFT_442836 [Trematosphaeria pertusa]KAF2240345.1 hypothetical protein BU26DRAFT_442836 [Trematosphaeria pertusa]
MQNFRPENIPTAISAFQPDGEVPVLNELHLEGGQCCIFKADFSDGESWSVRIPIHVQSDSQDVIINVLQAERDVLQEINRKGFRWAPKYLGSSFTFQNLVGFPFLALSWIEGSPLSWSPVDPPRPLRDKVLGQIAEIQMSLIECTKENRGTATKYFLRLIDNKLRRVRKGELPRLTEQDCFEQRRLLPQVLHLELENAPYAIDHGDLSPQNILADSEYNVTGIIDWGFAAKVPIQLAGRLPRLLQLQEPVLPPSRTLQQDRKTYIASLTSHSSEAASWISLIHSCKDVDFRDCFLESVISKGAHQLLARLGWKLPYRDLQSAGSCDGR